MRPERRWLSGLVLALVAIAMATEGSTALAQKPWRRSMYGYRQNRVQRSMRYARDYSQDLRNYAQDVKKIEPEVAKAEAANLGQNIALAQKELAAVRKSSKDDAETLAALEVIEKHLANAAETHKMLHAACNQDEVDGAVCTHCCTQITKELDEALAEHAALMKKLDARDPKEPAPQKDP